MDKYNYDGVIMGFNAKLTSYLNDQEKAEAIALENVFLGISKDWKARHPNKEPDYDGSSTACRRQEPT